MRFPRGDTRIHDMDSFVGEAGKWQISHKIVPLMFMPNSAKSAQASTVNNRVPLFV